MSDRHRHTDVRLMSWMRRSCVKILKIVAFSLLMLQGAQAASVSGEIDSFGYSPSYREVWIKGWVKANEGTQTRPVLRLRVANESYSVKNIVWIDQVTPKQETKNEERSISNFELSVILPMSLPSGQHVLNLQMQDQSGESIQLLQADGHSPEVKVKSILISHWRTLITVLIAIFGIFLLRKMAWPKLQHWMRGQGPLCAIVGGFAVFVAIGISGSSFGVMTQGAFGKSVLQLEGTTKKFFGSKDVRGDEWGVLMPNILAQLHHQPPFPIQNDLIGQGGQNMGVIGMTGAPVLQWAALARPATWGYFVLPLQQAMSWQWQLPFFGCILAVWLLLNCLRPQQRGLNMGLSLAFAVAPYAAAWSNWPLYATMYPAFAFVVVTKILTERRKLYTALLGVLLGWLLACWFLVLYPAWLIVIASALAMIGFGWAIDNRKILILGAPQLMAALLAVVVVAGLLGSWWLDTRDAIALMKATVYPGGRGTLTGGDMSWWWHLRGYHGSESVLRSSGPASNQSEASSYFYLPVLLAVLVLGNIVRSSAARWTVAGCALFMMCYWWFNFLGVPIEVAQYTLWGNLPTGRMEVAMGLVSVVVLALVARDRLNNEFSKSKGKLPWLWPGAVSAVSGLLVIAVLLHTPAQLARPVSVVYILAMVLSAFFICWWILVGRVGAGVALLIVVNLITTLTFNPLGLAPRTVELAKEQRPFVVESENPDRFYKTLVVLGDGIGAMTFAAVGVPIVNGVFYYPHKDFWSEMGLPEGKWPLVNRYQHLGFYLSPWIVSPEGYDVVQEGADQVHVHVNPTTFDFSNTGAKRVAMLKKFEMDVTGNSSLRFLGDANGMAWFAVK